MKWWQRIALAPVVLVVRAALWVVLGAACAWSLLQWIRKGKV